MSLLVFFKQGIFFGGVVGAHRLSHLTVKYKKHIFVHSTPLEGPGQFPTGYSNERCRLPRIIKHWHDIFGRQQRDVVVIWARSFLSYRGSSLN